MSKPNFTLVPPSYEGGGWRLDYTGPRTTTMPLIRASAAFGGSPLACELCITFNGPETVEDVARALVAGLPHLRLVPAEETPAAEPAAPAWPVVAVCDSCGRRTSHDIDIGHGCGHRFGDQGADPSRRMGCDGVFRAAGKEG